MHEAFNDVQDVGEDTHLKEDVLIIFSLYSLKMGTYWQTIQIPRRRKTLVKIFQNAFQQNKILERPLKCSSSPEIH